MFKNDTYQVELIEAYLSGALSASERDKFEAQLATDEKLQEQLRLHQLTIAALHHHGQREDQAFGEAMEGMTRDELKAMLERERTRQYDVAACVQPEPPSAVSAPPSIHPKEGEAQPYCEVTPAANAKPKKPGPRHRRGGWWYVLAAAALVTGVWFGARSFYMHKMAHRADQKISDTYIAMRESSEKAIGAARGDNEVFMRHHQELTDTLEISQVAPSPDSVEVVMQQALFAMRNGMTDQAIQTLEDLYTSSGHNKEVGIALAMAYVKANHRDKAVDMLSAMDKQLDGDPEIEELMKILTD